MPEFCRNPYSSYVDVNKARSVYVPFDIPFRAKNADTKFGTLQAASKSRFVQTQERSLVRKEFVGYDLTLFGRTRVGLADGQKCGASLGSFPLSTSDAIRYRIQQMLTHLLLSYGLTRLSAHVLHEFAVRDGTAGQTRIPAESGSHQNVEISPQNGIDPLLGIGHQS